MKTAPEVTYRHLGESTLLVEWPGEIRKDILRELIIVQQSLEKNPLQGVKEWNQAYNSLAIHFDPDETTFDTLKNQLSKRPAGIANQLNSRRWALPVCYEQQFGKDLEALAKVKNLTPDQLIELHSGATYTVYFLGFLPGFMYLGGLDGKLYYPRKKNPDRAIAAGSVAIGGTQTGIYPNESPGGWHVIGNCPVPLFDVKNAPPCFVGPGDEIRFKSVDQKQFLEIQKEVKAGNYHPKSELING